MNRIVLGLSLLVGSAVFACSHVGSHSHVGLPGVNIRLGPLAFALNIIRPRPCHHVVVAAAPVAQLDDDDDDDDDDRLSAPPVIAAVPVVVAPPVVRVYTHAPAPAPVVVAAPREAEEAPRGPSLLALKWMPGSSSTVALGESLSIGGPHFAHSPGVEVRVSNWFALRGDIEARRDGRSFDVIGGKFTFFPGSRLRPYASASLSLTETNDNPGRMHVGVMGAAGLDLYFGRHFFIEAEARYRRVPGCCGEESRLTALVGAGVAFF